MLAPTLLIGLGGKGSDIVCRVSKLVSPAQRKSIGFCVFDTDINELREIREANPHIYTVQTSTSLTVGEYLNIDKHARDNWFPVNPILNSKTLTEGAGQVRAISRLAFDTAVRAGNMLPLHNAIEDLYRLEEGGVPQALRVIIVSTLAGGTGSGLILPVALYVRNFLQTRFRQSANITRGFFILPEVLFEVVHGEAERNNLKCNAYATLRELDAFLMKGDGTLPERFEHKLKVEFPRAGSEDFEEYSVRPYDYCFLFDAQNIEGKKLNNFEQYLDHAANCIYAQSIGPMNKRSNSSEDNTIRALCRESGRNRYAGAGTSMLLYPSDDIRAYVSMDWVRHCVSEQWMRFDEMMIQKQKNDLLMREKGISMGSQATTGESYIDIVDNLVSQGDPFAVSIVDQCTVFDSDGVTRVGYKWESYLSALENYAKEQSNGHAKLREIRKSAETNINNVAKKNGASEVANSLRQTYADLRRYEKMVRQVMDESSKNAAYSLFNAPNHAILGDCSSQMLEAWIRDSANDFIHPNAIRYFLYQVSGRLDGDLRIVEEDMVKIEEKLGGFDKKTFDNEETEKVETVNDLGNDLGFFEKIQKMPERYKSIIGDYQKFIQSVDELLALKYRHAMLLECRVYVSKLSETFESFYLNFGERLKDIRRSMSEIRTKYTQTAGKTTRYVCASTTCLERLTQQYTYTGSAITVDGKLSNNIYTSIRHCALQSDKKSYKTQFNAIFDQGLVGYFSEKLDKMYGVFIDMDVISALEREAEYEKGYTDAATIEKYVREIITSTRALSNPFIERPLGEQRAPIAACSYHPSLNPKDDSPRSVLVNDILNNFGAVPDTDIEKNMIMFYQSIYALRANDLSKFAPALSGVHSEGEYYKAYYEVVNKIMPKSDKTPVVTPHIDKSWHIVTQMPDLDERSHKAQETRIYRAFFLGLLYELITYAPTTSRKYLYKLNVNSRRSEEFVVSNKTPCDKFYEVLDALTVNPVIVDTILSFSQRKLEQELHKHKIQFSQSELMNGLNHKLRLLEYGRFNSRANQFEIEFDLRKDGAQVTLFDIVALLKLSAPADAFHKSTGLDIMRVMLDVCHEYMVRMTAAEKIDMLYGQFVVSQYDTFKRNNLKWFLEYDEFGDYIDELVRVCSEKLEELDLIEEQDELDEIWRSTLSSIPTSSEVAAASSSNIQSVMPASPDIKSVTPSVSFTLPTGQQISIPVELLPKETRDAISQTMQKVLSEEMKEASDLLKDEN